MRVVIPVCRSFISILSRSLSSLCVFFIFHMLPSLRAFFFFFFNDPATPEIYPLPLHAPLPISSGRPPASESLLALTSTMNRIAVSFLFWVLPTRRASGGEIDGGGPHPLTPSPSGRGGTS